MNFLTRLTTDVLKSASSLGPRNGQSLYNFHSLTSSVKHTVGNVFAANSPGPFTVATRSIIRWHFPRASERKRVKRHGWITRMSTPSGRRVIMNRILKGRWVITH